MLEFFTLVAIGAISTLGIIMAGWASTINMHYLVQTTVAQMVSYEVPMVIVLLIPCSSHAPWVCNKLFRSNLLWYYSCADCSYHLLITSIAELGRAPFDLLEAESEIVAGFHIEYTGWNLTILCWWVIACFNCLELYFRPYFGWMAWSFLWPNTYPGCILFIRKSVYRLFHNHVGAIYSTTYPHWPYAKF